MNDIHTPMPQPADEVARVAALQRYQILDTEAEDDFDFLATLAAEVIGTPYAFVSLVDRDRVWYKAKHGRATEATPRDHDYCSLAILEPALFVVPDLTADARTAHLPTTTGTPQYRMYAGANLTTEDGFNIGVLCVLDVQRRRLLPRELELLQKLAGQAMQLIELRAKRKELEEALVKLEKLASTDPLTGLANRRTLMTKLAHEVQRSKRFATDLAVVLFDLDYFKDVDDRFGHTAGDAVLCNVAGQLLENIRVVDLAARYGGEEFCIVLPETDAKGAAVWAELFRARLAVTEQQHGMKVTGSFGISSSGLALPYQSETLLEQADNALYEAKARGRNRIVVAQRANVDLHVVSNPQREYAVSCC